MERQIYMCVVKCYRIIMSIQAMGDWSTKGSDEIYQERVEKSSERS